MKSDSVADRAPQLVEFSTLSPTSHDPGVEDRETEVACKRWARVTYSPGSSRDDWCDVPHLVYVIEGAISYEFEDGRPKITAAAGSALMLPESPRHRGSAASKGRAVLFVIDTAL